MDSSQRTDYNDVCLVLIAYTDCVQQFTENVAVCHRPLYLTCGITSCLTPRQKNCWKTPVAKWMLLTLMKFLSPYAGMGSVGLLGCNMIKEYVILSLVTLVHTCITMWNQALFSCHLPCPGTLNWSKENKNIRNVKRSDWQTTQIKLEGCKICGLCCTPTSILHGLTEVQKWDQLLTMKLGPGMTWLMAREKLLSGAF